MVLESNCDLRLDSRDRVLYTSCSSFSDSDSDLGGIYGELNCSLGSILSSFELPSPWDIKESRFDFSSPSGSNSHNIFRQEKRQECENDNIDERYSTPLNYRSSPYHETCDEFIDCYTPTNLLHFQSSPKRKHLVSSSQLTKRRCRSWIRLATPIVDSSFDEETDEAESTITPKELLFHTPSAAMDPCNYNQEPFTPRQNLPTTN